MKKSLFIIPILIALICLISLPLSEIWSWTLFKIVPSYARDFHVIQFKNQQSKQTIVLLGSAHYLHLESSYSFWNLKSFIENLHPNLLLVEIRPDSISKNKWGEGPIEMPFCAFVAKQASITVDGVDDWNKNFEDRENQIAINILNKSKNVPLTLVITGFSHINGLRKKLIHNDYKEISWTLKIKSDLFETPTEKRYPNGLKESLESALIEAKHSEKPPYSEWIQKRELLLQKIINTNQ